jgi:hypothetical protein
LIEFVQQSTLLRYVILSGSFPCTKTTKALIRLFLDAVAQNECVERLDFIHCCATKAGTLSRMFALRLKELRIDFTSANRHSRHQERHLLESVFPLDISLETLRLDINDTHLAVAVLTKLRGNSKLHTLHISCDLGEASSEVLEAVHALLLSDNVLRRLGLGGLAFNAQTMEILLGGILQRSVSLSRLDFLSCVFDEGAKVSFQKFMRTKVGVGCRLHCAHRWPHFLVALRRWLRVVGL